MKAHRFDPISFVFGATFIALSVILSSHHVALAAVRVKWLGAAFLLALGLALLLTTGRRSPNDS